MKVNELRIGNYVYFHGDVEEINMVDGFGVIGREEQPLCSIDEFEPIPLTEEWLLKFGFEKADEIYFIEFGVYSMTIKEYEKGKYILNPETHFNYVDIEYVHQLQNLYFALTGKELILTKNETN